MDTTELLEEIEHIRSEAGPQPEWIGFEKLYPVGTQGDTFLVHYYECDAGKQIHYYSLHENSREQLVNSIQTNRVRQQP